MIRVEIEETIQCPVEEVFERLVDIPGYCRWMPAGGLFRSCWQASEGAVGEGTVYFDETRLGTVRGEVSAFERPRKVVFHYRARWLGRTAMEGWPGYELADEGASATRLRHLAVARLHGPLKLLQPLVRRMAWRERRRTVDALKESLESEAASMSGSATIRRTGDMHSTAPGRSP